MMLMLTRVSGLGHDSDQSVISLLPSDALPNLEFPKFDGSIPKLWVKGAETYFDVFFC
jgi:hypothetical protein